MRVQRPKGSHQMNGGYLSCDAASVEPKDCSRCVAEGEPTGRTPEPKGSPTCNMHLSRSDSYDQATLVARLSDATPTGVALRFLELTGVPECGVFWGNRVRRNTGTQLKSSPNG